MSEVSPAVYFTKDIVRLFDCGANEVPRLVEEGTIPRPLPSKPRARKRWSRATVNRKLGIKDSLSPIVPEDELRRIIGDVVSSMFRESE